MGLPVAHRLGPGRPWLLNSLIVVIVGGMGSIFGAAAGAILYAFVVNFAASYLPTAGSDCCTQYSPILTFVLIALVLAVPAAGAVRERRMNPAAWTPRQQSERASRWRLRPGPCRPVVGLSGYWTHTILMQTFFYGIAAASLIFLSAYGGMVSLAQTALFGISGVIIGNLATQGGQGGTSKGLHLGWDPTLALVVAIG